MCDAGSSPPGSFGTRPPGLFQMEDALPEPQPALGRLGRNVRRARRWADLSQQALGDRASMSRGDLVDSNVAPATSGSSRWSGSRAHGDRLRRAAGRGGKLAYPPARGAGIPAGGGSDQSRTQPIACATLATRASRTGAEALDLERTSVGAYVCELRDAGEDLPYRRPPRGAAGEARLPRNIGLSTSIRRVARITQNPPGASEQLRWLSAKSSATATTVKPRNLCATSVHAPRPDRTPAGPEWSEAD